MGDPDDVQRSLESMLPELEDLRYRGLFSDREIGEIVKTRKRHERAIRRRAVAQEDFSKYIEYESQLDKLRKMRKKKLKVRKAGPADKACKTRILALYDAALHRFKGGGGKRKGLNIYIEALKYAMKIGSNKKVSKWFADAIRLHPREAGFWIMCASYEFEQNGNIEAARSILLRGLRINQRNGSESGSGSGSGSATRLWHEYYRLEALYLFHLRARRMALGLSGPKSKEKDLGAKDEANEEEDGDEGENSTDISLGKRTRSRGSELRSTSDSNNGNDDDDEEEEEEKGDENGDDDDEDEEEDDGVEDASRVLSVIYNRAIQAIPDNLQFRLGFVDILSKFTDTILSEVAILHTVHILLDAVNAFGSTDPEIWKFLSAQQENFSSIDLTQHIVLESVHAPVLLASNPSESEKQQEENETEYILHAITQLLSPDRDASTDASTDTDDPTAEASAKIFLMGMKALLQNGNESSTATDEQFDKAGKLFEAYLDSIIESMFSREATEEAVWTRVLNDSGPLLKACTPRAASGEGETKRPITVITPGTYALVLEGYEYFLFLSTTSDRDDLTTARLKERAEALAKEATATYPERAELWLLRCRINPQSIDTAVQQAQVPVAASADVWATLAEEAGDRADKVFRRAIYAHVEAQSSLATRLGERDFVLENRHADLLTDLVCRWLDWAKHYKGLQGLRETWKEFTKQGVPPNMSASCYLYYVALEISHPASSSSSSYDYHLNSNGNDQLSGPQEKQHDVITSSVKSKPKTLRSETLEHCRKCLDRGTRMHPGSCDLWEEFIHFERKFGSAKNSQSVTWRALRSVDDRDELEQRLGN